MIILRTLSVLDSLLVLPVPELAHGFPPHVHVGVGVLVRVVEVLKERLVDDRLFLIFTDFQVS